VLATGHLDRDEIVAVVEPLSTRGFATSW